MDQKVLKFAASLGGRGKRGGIPHPPKFFLKNTSAVGIGETTLDSCINLQIILQSRIFMSENLASSQGLVMVEFGHSVSHFSNCYMNQSTAILQISMISKFLYAFLSGIKCEQHCICMAGGVGRECKGKYIYFKEKFAQKCYEFSCSHKIIKLMWNGGKLNLRLEQLEMVRN